MTIYPNPTREIVNIAIVNPGNLMEDQNTFHSIRVISYQGITVFEKTVEPGSSYTLYSITFKSGIYIVSLITNGVIISQSKLLVL